MQERTRKRLAVLFLIAGLFLLAASVRQVGPAKILQAFRDLNCRIIWVLAFPLSWNLLQAQAWFRILAISGARVSYRIIFLVRLAGVAVSSLLPMGVLAGDPYRVYVLRGKVSTSEAASSLVIDRTFQTIAGALLLLLSGAIALFSVPASQDRQILLLAGGFLFFAVLMLLLFWQKKGLVSSLVRIVRKVGLGVARLDALSAKAQRLDGLIASFYRKKSDFVETLAYHFISRLAGVVEIYFIAALLGIPLTVSHALFLSTLDAVVNVIFVFVPGNIGVMEGGFGLLSYLLNLDPAQGVLIQLIRRIRQIFWIFLGLIAAQFVSRKD